MKLFEVLPKALRSKFLQHNLSEHFLLMNHHDGFMVVNEVSITLFFLNFPICTEVFKKINLTYVSYPARDTHLIGNWK